MMQKRGLDAVSAASPFLYGLEIQFMILFVALLNGDAEPTPLTG